MPDANFIGTREGAEYKWTSFKDAVAHSEAISHGVNALGLAPEVEGEGDGKKWRFMGIQSKNRAEWSLLNIAGMFQGVTTVAFFDTLGEDAMKFVVNQTQLTSIAVSKDLIGRACSLKASDPQGMTKTFENLIVFEEDLSDDDKKKISDAGLKLLHLSELTAKGKEAMAAGGTTTKEPEP